MTDKQPTALFLADMMEDGRWSGMHDLLAAAELRRLHEENEALRTRLAQSEQVPVAWGFQNTGITGSNRWMYLKETIPAEDQYRGVLWTPLYTAPPQRPWQGLTDEEIDATVKACNTTDTYKYFRAIEAKLKEKNT